MVSDKWRNEICFSRNGYSLDKEKSKGSIHEARDQLGHTCGCVEVGVETDNSLEAAKAICVLRKGRPETFERRCTNGTTPPLR